MADTNACSNCGAPRAPGYAACKFCKTPYPAAAAAPSAGGGSHGPPQQQMPSSIPCPKCGTHNEPTQQQCVQCKAWIVVQCIFCHAISPHNLPACLKCGEAFAGAPQRFAQRQSEAQSQQRMQMIGSVGSVAANVLGAAAGAAIGARWGSGGHHYNTYDHHHGGYGDRNYDQGYEGKGGGGFFGDGGGGGDYENKGGFFDSGGGGDYGGKSDYDSGGGGGGIMDSLFGDSGGGDSGGGSWGSDDS